VVQLGKDEGFPAACASRRRRRHLEHERVHILDAHYSQARDGARRGGIAGRPTAKEGSSPYKFYMQSKSQKNLTVLQLELAMQEDAFFIYRVEVWPINLLPNTRVSNANLSIKTSIIDTKLAIKGIIYSLHFIL
jgi:hypothetical protein